MNVNALNVEIEDVFANLLELAANDDVEGFRKYVDREQCSVDEVGLWYGRQKGSNQMVLRHMTPLMVASTYGSIGVLKLIVSLPEVDVNRTCGTDKSTALHYAVFGGSIDAVDVVKLLLAAGADPNLVDASGYRPVDVIVVSPKSQDMKYALQMLLATDEERNLKVSIVTSDLNSPPSHLNELTTSIANSNNIIASSVPERKEYPIDPSLPDIKNSIYSTDEFRMFSFKVRPCSRAYSHDWTECPFVHPGENARRRDPRKYHYSCVPCPDFRKGACRRGDMCEYAHGVFECWLHPAQYRTRLCKDGTSCNRRVCFFAHTQEELRPLYVSTGSAVPSPRSTNSNANAMDFAMNLIPGSPSSAPLIPLSPSANGISNMGWLPQQNIPVLHLPGSNPQFSRLRPSLHARDIPHEDLSLFGDIDGHLLNESSMNANLMSCSVSPKTLTPSNLKDIFAAEGSSPRYSDQALASTIFAPTRRSAVLNQFQHQQPSMLSPIKMAFSPRNVDNSMVPSGRMSPHPAEPVSPMSARMSMLARHERQHQHFRSLSSRDLGSNAASLEERKTWSKWGNGQVDWAVGTDDSSQLKRSSSFEALNNEEEPDLSWVQSLVKESPQDMKEKYGPRFASTDASSGQAVNRNDHDHIEQIDQSALGAWLEQMQLDQLMAQ